MTPISRRRWLQAAGLAAAGWSASGWLPALAEAVGGDPQRRRHCILLWMAGGPSQIDTFDLKPKHANGGEFQEIATRTPGVRLSENLPKLAEWSEQLAIVRSLTTKEGDHGRGTHLMRTGHPPMGPVQYPAIGASLGKALGESKSETPNYVSIAPYRDFSPAAYGPGFLGPKHAPLIVNAADGEGQTAADESLAELRVENLQAAAGVSPKQAAARRELWRSLENDFLARHGGPVAKAHETVYRRALHMMQSGAAEAFDLSREPRKVRQAYGRGVFGQGCLLARRLIEFGVPFVEVTLGDAGGGQFGWDTHQDNFAAVRRLSEQLDAGWSTLMRELEERNLLESTTIVWMGEFGRTPTINNNAGRDHHPNAWTVVFGGGGVAGGQAYGKTSDDGQEVVDGQTNVSDVLATLCQALSVSPYTENLSDGGRPIKIAEGQPIARLLA